MLEVGCWCAVSILPHATADYFPQHASGTATMTAWCRPAGIAFHYTLLLLRGVSFGHSCKRESIDARMSVSQVTGAEHDMLELWPEVCDGIQSHTSEEMVEAS